MGDSRLKESAEEAMKLSVIISKEKSISMCSSMCWRLLLSMGRMSVSFS